MKTQKRSPSAPKPNQIKALLKILGFGKPPSPSHAFYNLEGAICDIEASKGHCDAVSLRTIKRVSIQLMKVERAIASLGRKK